MFVNFLSHRLIWTQILRYFSSKHIDYKKKSHLKRTKNVTLQKIPSIEDNFLKFVVYQVIMGVD